MEDLLLETTDEDLRREAREDGEDIAAVAARAKAGMRETAVATMHRKMTQAKARMRVAPSDQTAPRARPALGRIKQIIQETCARNSKLGLAFRDGKCRSGAD